MSIRARILKTGFAQAAALPDDLEIIF